MSGYTYKMEKVKKMVAELTTLNLTGASPIDWNTFENNLKLAGGISDAALMECEVDDLVRFGLPPLTARVACKVFKKLSPGYSPC